MEAWGQYCAKEGLDFQAFCAGVDIYQSDCERWAQRGFSALRDAVWQSLQKP